eukprot:TRINITY_DN10272_c0_g1_i1.p1 TRINITY_DN10272_c0_g1~~TRINITY_DN10272_c0_g1_i1.p1  ORF type:complete len:252 (-),score=43.29 TRINITY_DN10272_c0_g1_i1:636-1391(-)
MALWSDQVEEEAAQSLHYEYEKGLTLIQVQGRTFRKAHVHLVATTHKPKAKRAKGPQQSVKGHTAGEEALLTDTEADTDESAGLNIHFDNHGKPGGLNYSLAMEVHPAFYKHLIGIKGQMRAKLQKDTDSVIDIPKPEDTTQHVLISARTKRSIASAKRRIDEVLQQSREKLPFTHFISMPLTSLKGSVKTFYDELLSGFTSANTRGFDDSLLLPPAQLHITLLMLKLYSPEEVQRVCQVHLCMYNTLTES